jgi:hypothetical protein
VTGASALTTVNAIPKVTAAGVLGESGLTDASGTVSGKRALSVDSLTTVALTNPTISTVTPSANDGVTCTYVLVLRAGNNTSTTAASAAVSTGAAGPTNCNSNTVVFTPDTNATYAQLSRTVGGTTQGLITAMAAWANNSTNCPAGVCTYIDTGSAASGAAPTANTTGQVTAAKVDGGAVSGTTGTFSSIVSAAPGGTVAGWAKYTVAYTNTAFIVASTTATVTLVALPANGSIEKLRRKHSVAFAGTGITSAVCSVGDGTTADAYGPNFDVFQAVSNTAQLWDSGAYSTTAAGHNIVLTCVANTNWGDGAATVLTAGSVDTHIGWSVLP